MLIPTALNMIQGDSNQKAQNAQADIDRRYSPWLGNNPAGQYGSQTNDAGSISAGLQAYNNSQEEQNREKQQYDKMFEMLSPDKYYQNKGANLQAPGNSKWDFVSNMQTNPYGGIA